MARPHQTPETAMALALFGLLVVGVQSHGSLTVPRSRNVLFPIQSQAWWKDHGNGHGGGATAGPKPLNGPGGCVGSCALLEATAMKSLRKMQLCEMHNITYAAACIAPGDLSSPAVHAAELRSLWHSLNAQHDYYAQANVYKQWLKSLCMHDQSDMHSWFIG